MPSTPADPSRREFLESAGAATLAGLLGTRVAAAGRRDAPGRLRVALLDEAGFPSVDAPAYAAGALAGALEGCEVAPVGVADLAARLSPERCDVFVSPYGSAFPLEGWEALKRYLDAGGHWVNLGGVPCAVPVARSGALWRAGDREPARPRELGIVLACAVDVAGVRAWRPEPELPWAAPLASGIVGPVWEPYWRLSSVPEIPEEGGSPGPTEAVVRPLVSGLDADGTPLAVPYVMVDRVQREFAGGRWVFATLVGAVPGPALRVLVEAAARGVRRLEVRPTFACYRDGERPAATLRRVGYPRGAAAPFAATCRLTVSGEDGARLGAVDVELSGTDAAAIATADLGAVLPDPLAPGLYRLDAVLAPAAARGGGGAPASGSCATRPASGSGTGGSWRAGRASARARSP